MKEKMYLVSYSQSDFDDHKTVNIFVTKDKVTALNYVNKFNRIHKEYLDYYMQFSLGTKFPSLSEENHYKYGKRFYSLINLHGAKITEIEIR